MRRSIRLSLLLICVVVSPCLLHLAKADCAADMNQALDVIVSFLQSCYPDEDLSFCGSFERREDYYGNVLIEGGSPEQRLALVEFELSGDTYSIITFSFYDPKTHIHYYNCTPADEVISKADVNITALKWIKDKYLINVDEEIENSHTYLIRNPNGTQLHCLQWELVFENNEASFTIFVDAITAEILYCKYDLFHYDGKCRDFKSSTEVSFPDRVTKRYQIGINGVLVGEIDAQQFSSGEGQFCVFPLINTVEVCGGTRESNRVFTFHDKTFVIDKLHIDLMPAREFKETGLLSINAKHMPNTYCCFYGDLWVDETRLLSFFHEYLNCDIVLVDSGQIEKVNSVTPLVSDQ